MRFFAYHIRGYYSTSPQEACEWLTTVYYGYHNVNTARLLLGNYDGINYKYIREYIVMLPYTYEHHHSNNYIVSGKEVCSCQLPNHIHKFMYNLYNVTQHQVVCYCGYTKYENHNFRYNKLNLVCKDYSYSKYSGEE